MSKKLPIGIQNFRKIRKENCYYVDKTPFALRLIEQGSYFFFTRPRRFGKSLFLDTLKELFEGNDPYSAGCIQQLKSRQYADKYRQYREPIHLIGVEFSRERRNIAGFGYETV